MPRCFIVCTMCREAVTLTNPIALPSGKSPRFVPDEVLKVPFYARMRILNAQPLASHFSDTSSSVYVNCYSFIDKLCHWISPFTG